MFTISASISRILEPSPQGLISSDIYLSTNRTLGTKMIQWSEVAARTLYLHKYLSNSLLPVHLNSLMQFCKSRKV